MPHLLIVDDEVNVASALDLLLRREGYETTIATTPSIARTYLQGDPPFDLVLLDLNLGDPLVNGLVICQEIRRLPRYLPVIMVTVADSDDAKVLGLDLGADDYMTKPYNERELLARIRATLRTVATTRAPQDTPPLRIDHALQIDTLRRRVYLHGQEVELTRRQYDLLIFLALNPGRPWGRQTLLDKVWGDTFDGVDRTVDKHISELRQKIEPDPNAPYYIVTEHGFGYRFRHW